MALWSQHAPTAPPSVQYDPTNPQLPDDPNGAERRAMLAAVLLEAFGGREKLATQLWARTPAYITEKYDTPAAAALTTYTIPQAVSQPVVIESIVACVPGTATLQLGDKVIYFGTSGTFTLAPLTLLLNPQDQRAVTTASGVTGALSVIMTGHQLPQWGNLS